MAKSATGIAKRAAWSVSSQATSSLSNFLLTVTVLAAATRSEFAIFSLCFTTYLLVSQLARSVSSLPLMILYSDDEEAAPGTSESHSAAGVSIVIGLAAAIVLLAVALATGSGLVQFAIVALGTPLLLFHDSLRHMAFARSRPQVAAASDSARLALQGGGSVLAWALGSGTVPVLLGIWVISGIVAGTIAGSKLQAAPTLRGTVPWLRRHRALWEKLAYEFLMTSGSFYALLYGLALLAGVAELGRFRAAQTLIGPVIVLLLAGNALGIPEGVRIRRDLHQLRRMSLILSSGLAAVAIVWGLAVYVFLPEIGPRVFASSWETARPLIPILTVFAAGVGVSTGATSALRAVGDSSWIMWSRGITGALTLLVGLPLAASTGALGALVALAALEAVLSAAAWVRLEATRKRPVTEEGAPPSMPE